MPTPVRDGAPPTEDEDGAPPAEDEAATSGKKRVWQCASCTHINYSSAQCRECGAVREVEKNDQAAECCAPPIAVKRKARTRRAKSKAKKRGTNCKAPSDASTSRGGSATMSSAPLAHMPMAPMGAMGAGNAPYSFLSSMGVNPMASSMMSLGVGGTGLPTTPWYPQLPAADVAKALLQCRQQHLQAAGLSQALLNAMADVPPRRVSKKRPVALPRPASEPLPPNACKCKNTRCLKLYCICFKAERYCDGCKCTDCQNTPDSAIALPRPVSEKRQGILDERRGILAALPGRVFDRALIAKTELFCHAVQHAKADAYHCSPLPPERMQKLEIAKLVGESASKEAKWWYRNLHASEQMRLRELDGKLCVMPYRVLVFHGFDFERNPLGKRRNNTKNGMCYICTDAVRCLEHFWDAKGETVATYLITLANADVVASGWSTIGMHTDRPGKEEVAPFGASRNVIPVSDVYKVDRMMLAYIPVVKDGELVYGPENLKWTSAENSVELSLRKYGSVKKSYAWLEWKRAQARAQATLVHEEANLLDLSEDIQDDDGDSRDLSFGGDGQEVDFDDNTHASGNGAYDDGRATRDDDESAFAVGAGRDHDDGKSDRDDAVMAASDGDDDRDGGESEDGSANDGARGPAAAARRRRFHTPGPLCSLHLLDEIENGEFDVQLQRRVRRRRS